MPLPAALRVWVLGYEPRVTIRPHRRLLNALCLGALLALITPAHPALAAYDEAGGDDVRIAILNTTDYSMPSIDIAENGDIYVAVSVANTDRNSIYVYRSTDGGDHWSYWGGLDSTDVEYSLPSLHIAEGTQNKLYLAFKYQGPSETHSEIRIAYSPLSSAIWTVHTVLSSPTDWFYSVSLTSDEMNFASYRLYLAAEGWDGNGRDIWFTRSTDYGFSWEAGYKIASLSNDANYFNPMLCYGRSGVVHCAWKYSPAAGTGMDEAVRYRRALNYAAGGISDWQGTVYMTSSSNGTDENFATVAASHGSDQVAMSWELVEDNLTLGSYIRTSSDAGLAWGTPQWMEYTYWPELLALPGTSGFSMLDTYAYGKGLRSADDADPLTWSDDQILADRDYWFAWSSSPEHRSHDYNVAKGNRRGMVWTAVNPAGADTVFFDAEWRRDPGYANLEEGFPMTLSAGVVAPPAVCELDGDMESEIVFGDVTGHIIALNHDGTAVPGWPVDIGTFQDDATIAIGNLNDDPYNEVVAGNDAGYVHAFDHVGVELSGWPRNTGTAAPAYVAIGAISTEARQIAACSGTKVFLYNGSGSPVPGFPLTVAGNITASPAIGDVDGDGDREIVILQEHFMNVIRGDHTVQAFRNVTADGQSFTNAPTLADLNLDGDLEIMAPTDQGRLYVMNPDGSNYPGGWPYIDPAGVRLTSVAAAQIRAGTEPELIFGVEGAAAPEVHAFYEYFTELGGYPNPTGAGWFLYGMPIVDVLDEGSPDVIAAARDKKAYGWDNFGRELPGWPEDLAARCEVSAASGDIDADGRVEVVFTTYDPPSVVVYDLGASVYRSSFYTTYWWPMYGYNPLRQGCLACDNDRVTNVPENPTPIASILFAAPAPNPTSGPVSLRFDLPEPAAVRLECFDAQGRLVAHVLKDEMEMGPHEISWLPRSGSGAELAAGVYYLRLTVNGPSASRELSRKIVVMR